MKAPEKIYINSNLEDRTWLIGKGDTSFIEYTRTDDFIEKACNWLKKYGGSYWMDDYNLPTDNLVNDFKKYMKGE